MTEAAQRAKEEEWNKLVRQRNATCSRIKKLLTVANKHATVPMTLMQALGYLDHLDTYQQQLETMYSTMLAVCEEENLAGVMELFEEQDDKIFEVGNKLKTIRDALQPPPATPIKSETVKQSSVRLPTIELPTFDGKYEDWHSFKDLFSATIEGNKSLSGAQKLSYLKSCLKGEPLQLIQAFEITDDNYDEASALLAQRYENVREIVNSVLKRLFNQKPVSRECAVSLKQLMDTTQQCIRSLKTLNRPVDKWDDILVYLVTEKLDPETRKHWAMSQTSTTPAKFEELTTFVEKHVRGLLAAGTSSVQPKPSATNKWSNNSGSGFFANEHAAAHHGASVESCVVCSKSHQIFRCPKFMSMNVSERTNTVKRHQLCFNCLRADHSVKECKSANTCRKCKKQHNTLLHFEKSATNSEQSTSTTSNTASIDEYGNSTQVLLATALVKVHDHSGSERQCRILVDQGSQGSFITEQCVTALGIRRKRSRVTISGIGSASIGMAKGSVNITLHSCFNDFSVPVEFLILPKVTSILPTLPCNKEGWEHIQGLQLADPHFNVPAGVDMLIDAGIATLIMKEGRIQGPANSPTAVNSSFGWLLSGRIISNNSRQVCVNFSHCETETILRRFWELEELPAIKYMTAEEKSCEDNFLRTHHRDTNGRYVVELPFNDKVSKLGNSRDRAIGRLKQVEKRLATNPQHRLEYNKFMLEYLELNHMQWIPKNQVSHFPNYYLPHHFVLKEDSSTTKFRVVFDGSAKTSGISLNDCLMVGPTVQDNLWDILIRFRSHVVALKADITKMYRQFNVSPKHQDYQRIVWRESPDLPIQDYRLATVTYGTAAAPFLATRCLKQLASDGSSKFPIASKVLDNDYYVDDELTGDSTTERAILLYEQVTALCKSAGMEIRKWASNDPAVMEAIPPELRETNPNVELDNDSTVKALGVRWNTVQDVFTFAVATSTTGPITKRTLLSELAKVFDPIGLLTPVTVRAKIMLQGLWKSSLGWDEMLPDHLQQEWITYQSSLESIKSLKVPRCITFANGTKFELHGFADASEKAYSAAVYLRSVRNDGTTLVRLITSKTKVAPIKTITIPRLELCGVCMLSELVISVKKALSFECEIIAWTDSTIVLKWISDFPGRWSTFVAHRVAKVQTLIPSDKWKHVPTDQNPADCASRGISAQELIEFSMWWEGPEWLKHSGLPSFAIPTIPNDVNLEEKKTAITVHHCSIDLDLIKKYSEVNKLKSVLAYCLRFIGNCRAKKAKATRRTGPLLCIERQSAWHRVIQTIQESEFGPEISSLQSSKPIPNSSKLKQLHPFLDKYGLLRVGGRLQNSNLPEQKKHQIILPANNDITTLVIQHAHLENLHGGFQLCWSMLQREYWILRARNIIRQLIRKCVTCRRTRGDTVQQLMGSLPTARVNPSRPFLNCGVDYAGPFNLRIIKGRGNRTFKCYFSIFVCFATKAVHLEAVTDLTTEAFIAALKRFVSRRGISSHIYSDCGTNFVGADTELKELLESSQNQSTISHFLTDKGITWHFNPPSAPHHGGLWEAGVKSVKHHLKRVIGVSSLTLEEFVTILCQVEACLNSRPLCALSCDPVDLNALTPGHFIIGEPLTAIPEPDLTLVKTNHLSNWQRTQSMVQNFWNRWSNEYLSSLQQRFKWTAERSNLEVGDLVTIKDDNLPPLKWKFGRIMKVHPGKDDLVRTVTLKTSSGEVKRPIVKLCPILYKDE